jgi:hypothetical protein
LVFSPCFGILNKEKSGNTGSNQNGEKSGKSGQLEKSWICLFARFATLFNKLVLVLVLVLASAVFLIESEEFQKNISVQEFGLLVKC